MNKVYKLEQGLRYSGPYTRTKITEDYSGTDDFNLYSDENPTGQPVVSASFLNDVSVPDHAFVSSYRLSGNANGNYTWNRGTVVNLGTMKTAYASGGNVVPFYMPAFSLKITNDRWLYVGWHVLSYNSVNQTFAYEFGEWWSNGADANTASTVTNIHKWLNGAINYDMCIGVGILRATTFGNYSGQDPDPPYDEICIKLNPQWDTAGTLQPNADVHGSWYATPTVPFSSNRNLLSLARCMLEYGGYPLPVDPGPETGPTSGGGGYGNGSFSGASDSIALPNHPGMGVTSAGFVRVYNIGSGGLSSIGFELFPPLAYTPPTSITANDTTEAIINGFNQIVTFLANVPSFFDQIMANTLINYVIDCHVIPVSPGSGSSEAIHVGPKTLNTVADRIYTDYVDVSCGSINIAEFYDNFADMLTTAKLYLPFIGFVPVRPEWWQGNTLAVDYKFNVIDGSFTCYVRSGGKYVNNNGGLTIVGQYAGSACMHIPITGVAYSSMVSGIVGAAGGMVTSAGNGNIAALATSAIDAAQSRGDMPSSNSYSASAAFLGCRVPFLMIERPVSSYSANYAHENGFPANIYAKLGDVPGFVTMENVHLDGIPCTDEERKKIAELLKRGIVV